MGTERRRVGQHVLLSAAGLILLAASACIPCRQESVAPQVAAPASPVPAVRDRLENVDPFISKGDFEGALKYCQDLLGRTLKGQQGEDEALLTMGLLSAHYANPKKDYKKALGYFQRIEREYPKSPLVEEARIWISVLESFEKAKQVDIEVEELKKGLGR